MSSIFKNFYEDSILAKRKIERKEDIRGPYFGDQTAIIHSMGFRRLKNKTQVFFSPENDHICTRIEHSLHVSTISTVICKALGLNYELAQAIALGHDLGHAPFGHAGEEIISDLAKKHGNNEYKFYHEIQSLRVVDKLENDGKGLNLTFAVRDGIISHCGEKFEKCIEPARELRELEEIKDKSKYPITYEGCVVRMADKISYLGRDIEDALKAKIIAEDDIPKSIIENLGEKNGEIIDTFVNDFINCSIKEEKPCFSEEIYRLMIELKEFNYEKIYKNKKLQDYKVKARKVIEIIFEHLLKEFQNNGWNLKKYNDKLIPLNVRFGNYLKRREKLYRNEGTSALQIVIDYISGMTDSYALKCAQEIVFPKPISFD